MVAFDSNRDEMVDEQLAARGIVDRDVLEAMRSVRREDFLPEALAPYAYEDAPLPIGERQTMSQPYVVALMIEALTLSATDRVLEIGTGSGYAAAVVSRLAATVDTVERFRSLYELAAARFERLGYANVRAHHGDGSEGWPEHAPYDAILVSAGAPEVPAALRDQLVVGGRLVIPIGESRHAQELVRFVRTQDGRLERRSLGPVRFVPLVGSSGWSEGGVFSFMRR